MRKGQQQIRCSSDVSIAGRIGSRPQVISVFIPVLSSPIPNSSLSNQDTVHVILHSSSHGLLKLCPNPNLGVFSSPHTDKATIKQWLMSSVCLVSDTGSSSSEDEGPKRPTAGPGAKNGDVRRRRSRTPSPRRRHRDASPRSDTCHGSFLYLSDFI